jgi:RNA polymerase sigma factor for flagellar operon FliA
MATSPAANITLDPIPCDFPLLDWSSLESMPCPSSDDREPDDLASPFVENSAAVREQVLLAHLPLVRFVARRIYERLPQHIDFEDLVSAGIIGLVDAYGKFDSAKNVQFRSYAQFRIRGAILDSLRSLDWGSRELRRKAREIEAAVQRLTQRLGERPQENQIAEELGMPLREYQHVLCELKNLEISSLHELHAEDSSEEEIAFVPAAPEEDPFFRCVQREKTEHLAAAIRNLPEREARILSLYYMEGMTLREIGAVIGLAESRVSQIRTAAIHQLRMKLTRNSTKIVPRRNKPSVLPAGLLRRQSVAAQRFSRP